MSVVVAAPRPAKSWGSCSPGLFTPRSAEERREVARVIAVLGRPIDTGNPLARIDSIAREIGVELDFAAGIYLASISGKTLRHGPPICSVEVEP